MMETSKQTKLYQVVHTIWKKKLKIKISAITYFYVSQAEVQ